MNKQEKIVVAVLFAMLAGWMLFGPSSKPRVAPPAEGTNGVTVAATTNMVPAPAAQTELSAPPDPQAFAVIDPAPTPTNTIAAPETIALPEPLGPPTEPAQVVTLENGVFSLDVSTHGGAVVASRLASYRQTRDTDSGPRSFDFSAAPSLSLVGVPGFGTDGVYDIDVGSSASQATLRREFGGLRLVRAFSIDESYHLTVKETWVNAATNVLRIPRHGVQIGPMAMTKPKTKTPGPALPFLGIDTLAAKGGEKVRHWGSKGFLSKDLTLPDYFRPEDKRSGGLGCGAFKGKISEMLPERIAVSSRELARNGELAEADADWVAVKTKFFAQIVSMPEPAPGFILEAQRDVGPGETPDSPDSWAGSAVLKGVSAQISLDAVQLVPGQTLDREFTYYVGPKKLGLLKDLGNRQESLMEFRKLTVICEPLLTLLNILHGLIPNYGIAIILLTIIVKGIFWPITQKSTEHMRRMSELQPLTKEIQAKYKSQPEKVQQEIMKLYKEKKVNPMAGCLPMVIQIPVFFGLFTVLRSAVELRYAHFLWIGDLSEPEGLFQAFFASIPFIPSLNILPLFMTALTVIQQRMTPTTGDPQQQKMMQMMPVIFLFILYNMASGLVLYWSLNQLLSIVQLVAQKRSKAKKDAAEAAA